MRSYIKIYGPPVYDALKELEKIAIQMPQVTMMNTIIEFQPSKLLGEEPYDYFATTFKPKGQRILTFEGLEVTKESLIKSISRSGARVGEYDFYFEWEKKPTMKDLNELIKRIDKALKPLGCKYTITTIR